MKKIFILIVILFSFNSINSYSKNRAIRIKSEDYTFPFHDRNVATIIGSSTLMMNGVTPYEDLDVTNYKINIKGDFKIPPSLWYEDGYKFSLTKQPGEAPLIFIIAGTGAFYDSPSMKRFQRILSDGGYHVITVTSPITGNFIVNASTLKLPGSPLMDSKDLHRVLKKSYEKIKKKVKVTDFYLTGYSLGGTQAAFVSYIDEQEKVFNFKRIYMINPTVNLKKSAIKLDDMFDKNLKDDRSDMGPFLDDLLKQIAGRIRDNDGILNPEIIFGVFKEKKLTTQEMEILIGLSFRLAAINLNYITDLIHERGIYIEDSSKIKRTTPLFPYFRNINFASFYSYLEKIAIPMIEEKGMSYSAALGTLDMRHIDNYLRNTDKIALVTNKDELILDEEDISYLEDVFGDRMILYPYGGHCGNMFYKDNVKTMLKFLGTGRLMHESE